MNAVFSWLANPKRNYNTGIELYNQYKNTNRFDKYFAEVKNPSQNDIHFKILFKRLSDINRKILSGAIPVEKEESKIKPIEVTQINRQKKAERVIIVDNPVIDAKELPENLKPLWDENKKLTVDIAGKHAELKLLGEGETDKAAKLSTEICEMEDKRTENWKKIDTWWNNKKKGLEENSSSYSKNITEIAKRISNLENYIRRESAKIKTNPKNKAKYQAKIDKWKVELNELRGN